jgi:ureidoglycolate lyase
MRIISRPLTASVYAPYGHVVMASPRGEPGRAVNQGTAQRFDHLAPVENLRPESAALNVCVFRCAPRSVWPLEIELLEKHPASTQVFLPMNAGRYLVIVALGGGGSRKHGVPTHADHPDLSTLAAFIATGTQGVSYHPGVWHHPIIALDAETSPASSGRTAPQATARRPPTRRASARRSSSQPAARHAEEAQRGRRLGPSMTDRSTIS